MTEVQDLLAQYEAEFAATKDAVPTMKCGEVYRTGYGGALTVVRVSYGDVSETAVREGIAPAIHAVLTEDGRSAIFEWASADEDSGGDVVYVEQWKPTGRTFHGYVDSVSRKVVQTG